MQSIEIRSLFKAKLTKSVPATVDEFDQMAKESGAALREANRNVLYRSTLATFRNAFLHGSDAEGTEGQPDYVPAVEGLDKITGIERLTKVTKPEVKNAEGVVTEEAVEAWAETEQDYFDRVMAQLVKDGKFASVEAAEAEYLPTAQQVLDSIPFDPSKAERKSAGPKKTPKTYVEVAEEIVKVTGSIEAAVQAFARKTGITVEPTKEALAKAVWDDQRRQAKQRAAEYANA